MKKRAIATTLLLATILTGGITACTQSNSSNLPQSDTFHPPSPSDKYQSNKAKSQKHTRKSQVIRQQIEAVLTPDQKQELQTKLQQGEKMRQALSTLNLTSDQKTKIQEIYKAARAQRQQQSQTNSQ